MKKVSIVLLMGLAIGMTFMSCSKEEVLTNCNEEVIGFSTQLSDTQYTTLYLVDIVDSEGVVSTKEVSEWTWNNLKDEVAENGFACLTSY